MDETKGMSVKGILRLILAKLDRLENSVSAASEYMTTALADLDTQMVELQTRLSGDAQALKDAIAELDLAEADTAALTAAADRVSHTADLVSGLAQPSAVVDETQPEVITDPIPAEETGTTPTDGTPAQETPAQGETPAQTTPSPTDFV